MSDLTGTGPIRIGVVGAGQVSQMCHIEPLKALPDVELVAIADLRPRLAKMVAGSFDIPQIHQDHRSLFAVAELDGVIVVTNRDVTGPIVFDALAAGLNVMSEKPLTHAVAQAEQLVSLAGNRDLILAAAYMKRHDPGFLRAAAILANLRSVGEWGRLERVEAWSRAGDTLRPLDGFLMSEEIRPKGLDAWPMGPQWLAEKHHAAYANFLNVHVHALNWLAALLGPLNVETARRNSGDLFQFELIALAIPIALVCEYGQGPGWHEGARFIFEAGSFSVTFPPPFNRSAIADIAFDTPLAGAEIPLTGNGWSFARQAAAFVSALAHHQTPVVTGSDALADLEVVEAIWRKLTE